MDTWMAMLIYLAIINVVAFILYGVDKRRAERDEWRISEATLMTVAVIGGSLGAWLGMYVFHHKTRHKKFYIGIPLILLAQIVLAVFLAYFM